MEILPQSIRVTKTNKIFNLLTPRELEILSLLINGLSNQELADKLFVQEKTIKFHTSNLYKKFNVKSRSRLLSLFIDDHVKYNPRPFIRELLV